MKAALLEDRRHSQLEDRPSALRYLPPTSSHGGVRGLMGEVTTIIPGETPCLECLFPRGPEKKEPFPVFGATAALVASLQVLEAIKLLAGLGKLLTGRMLYINGSEMQFLSIQMKQNKQCRVCGGR